MKFSEILNIVKKRWWLFIVLPLVLGAIAAAYTYTFMPNEYTSVVSIYILHKVEVLDKKDNSTQVVPDWGTSSQVIGDLLTLIKSSKAKEAIMEEMGLSSLNQFTINVGSTDKNSRVLNISATGKDPYEVAELVNCTARQVAKLSVEQMYVETVNIIEEAQPATSPSGPNRKIFILGAAGIGFCIALIIAFLNFILDTTIKSAKDLREIEDMVVLAQIPWIKKKERA